MAPSHFKTSFALPPYTYVPGRFPHPIRDPLGHSFGHTSATSQTFVPSQWNDCQPYRYGIELFNAGYFWESHEMWEGLWHDLNRQGAVAEFLKGLIKLAAAGVKAYDCNCNGVSRHAARAGQLFESVASQLGCANERVLGLEVEELRSIAWHIKDHAESFINSQAPIPRNVFSFRLKPIENPTTKGE